MTRKLSVVIGIAVFSLIAAAPAWAVVVEVPVQDADGNAVAGATVSIGTFSETTGPDGVARLDVPAGEYDVVVTFNDVSARQRVQVREGAGVQRVPPIRLPGGRRGDWPRGLVGFGIAVGGNRAGDLTLTRQEKDDVRRAGTQTQTITERFGPGDPELDESNRFTKRHTIVPSILGWIMFPVSRAGLGPLGSRRPGPTASASQDAGPGQTDEDDTAGGWRFYPAGGVGFGRADVEFLSAPPPGVDQPTENSTGDGPLFGVAVNGVLFPCSTCRWFTSFGYNYSWTPDIPVTRSPSLQSQLGNPNIRVTGDDLEYKYWAHAVQVALGHATSNLAVWGGVRATFRRARFGGRFGADFSQALGFAATQDVTFSNDLERDSVEGLAGTDIRLFGSPLFLRLEGSTNGDDHSFSAGIAVGLGG